MQLKATLAASQVSLVCKLAENSECIPQGILGCQDTADYPAAPREPPSPTLQQEHHLHLLLMTFANQYLRTSDLESKLISEMERRGNVCIRQAVQLSGRALGTGEEDWVRGVEGRLGELN